MCHVCLRVAASLYDGFDLYVRRTVRAWTSMCCDVQVLLAFLRHVVEKHLL